MKAGKEEIVGLVKAVEIYVNRDHAADMSIWERRVQYIIDQVSSIPGVNAWREVPYGIGNLSPQVALTWDVNRLEVSYQEFFDQMKAGSPPHRHKTIHRSHA
jgi:L-seryl-tRNA(Ser) seleniumtransferase